MEVYKNVCIGEILFPDCPVRNILARVGDKWSLLVMHELLVHPAPMRFSELRKAIPDVTMQDLHAINIVFLRCMRFSELRKAIPDISQKVLTATLRNLIADGFLVRKVYAEVPPRTEYALTPRAHSFMDACRPMVRWAIENFADIIKDREKASNSTSR